METFLSYSKFVFDVNFNISELEKEYVSLSNDEGGKIEIKLENRSELRALNKAIVDTADNIVPRILVITKNEIIDDRLTVFISIKKGNQKPYRTKTGEYVIKSGADKRQMSTQELQRMVLQSAGISTEELPIHNSNLEKDINTPALYLYFEKEYEMSIKQFMTDNKVSFEQLLNNMSLATGSHLNLNGLMFFGKDPQRFRPLFLIKAVHFRGNDLGDTHYISSDDFEGTLDVQFQSTKNFILSNLPRKQNGNSFNSIGTPEISEIAIEEAIINALVHRDYGILSPIRVFIFQDRLEIINPGHLVNHLTIDKIKLGTTTARNPKLLRFASRILVYRGLGSGITRILKEHPKTDFINDRDGHQFKVVMWRD